jgi:hypothetical protein
MSRAPTVHKDFCELAVDNGGGDEMSVIMREANFRHLLV